MCLSNTAGFIAIILHCNYVCFSYCDIDSYWKSTLPTPAKFSSKSIQAKLMPHCTCIETQRTLIIFITFFTFSSSPQ